MGILAFVCTGIIYLISLELIAVYLSSRRIYYFILERWIVCAIDLKVKEFLPLLLYNLITKDR